MPALTMRSATSWAAAGRGGQHADGDAVLGRPAPRGRRGGAPGSAHQLADLGLVGVDQGHDGEAAGGEAAVVGEGPTEVPGPGDDDGPVVGEAEGPADLVEQELDVVPHPPRPVGAEVGEVLAHLRGVDSGEVGQALRRAGGLPVVGQGQRGPAGTAAGGRPWPQGCDAARPALPPKYFSCICSQSRAARTVRSSSRSLPLPRNRGSRYPSPVASGPRTQEPAEPGTRRSNPRGVLH